MRGQEAAFARHRTGEKVDTLPRVLLIDDTPEIAELLSFSLRDLGYEVRAVGYSTAVNELIAEHRAAAVVLDCTAYDMSEALFDAIRQHPDHGTLPIVVISDTPEVADRSLSSRNARHVLLIPKPFTGSQVGRALAQLLQ
ncbi:MAG TPA: response regulator [Candidatus Aquilonibacter sp.]|jgi:CheY-like chemotaxis protein|nr:response regulator [Candidatus Aquilonibacter sp.]